MDEFRALVEAKDRMEHDITALADALGPDGLTIPLIDSTRPRPPLPWIAHIDCALALYPPPLAILSIFSQNHAL